VREDIPTVVGFSMLMLAGCSDAQAIGNTLAKVCKEGCKCPTSEWNEEKNCKQYCEGYATLLEATIADNAIGEPCDELRRILGDIEGCLKGGCGEYNACLSLHYYDLYECWPSAFQGYYGYTPLDATEPMRVSGAELLQQLMFPIPGAIAPELLHGATRD
jgi:hypothetical protein